MQVSGGPNRGYALVLASGGATAGFGTTPFGVIDVNLNGGFTILMDGLFMSTGTAFDAFAHLNASGVSTLPLPLSLLSPSQQTLQALIADPSDPSGYRLTAATDLTITASAGIIYVSATTGAPGNPGTQAAPLDTISGGIAASAGAGPLHPPVFVASGTYNESPAFVNGVSVYGGLDPMTWAPAIGPPTTVNVGTIAAMAQAISAPTVISRLEFYASSLSVPSSASIALGRLSARPPFSSSTADSSQATADPVCPEPPVRFHPRRACPVAMEGAGVRAPARAALVAPVAPAESEADGQVGKVGRGAAAPARRGLHLQGRDPMAVRLESPVTTGQPEATAAPDPTEGTGPVASEMDQSPSVCGPRERVSREHPAPLAEAGAEGEGAVVSIIAARIPTPTSAIRAAAAVEEGAEEQAAAVEAEAMTEGRPSRSSFTARLRFASIASFRPATAAPVETVVTGNSESAAAPADWVDMLPILGAQVQPVARAEEAEVGPGVRVGAFTRSPATRTSSSGTRTSSAQEARRESADPMAP